MCVCLDIRYYEYRVSWVVEGNLMDNLLHFLQVRKSYSHISVVCNLSGNSSHFRQLRRYHRHRYHSCFDMCQRYISVHQDIQYRVYMLVWALRDNLLDKFFHFLILRKSYCHISHFFVNNQQDKLSFLELRKSHPHKLFW